MADRALCAAAAASLAAVPKERRPKVTVGFDGFIDNIIDVVAKRADAQGTASQVAPVNGEQRVAEVARMLGGERLSGTTLAHAKEMLGDGAAP